MKKFIYYILFSVFLLNIFCTNTSASTNTYERTRDNLRVPSSVNSSKTNTILNTPSVNEKEKIYDFAKLIDDSYEANILEKLENFIDTYNMDMVVVTVDTYTRRTATEFADDFYDYNYFGKNKNRDGILLLIDMYQRQVAISTTGHAILVYDDERIDYMLDNLEYYLKDSKYISAIESFIEDSSMYAKEGIPSSNKYAHIDENGNYVVIKPFPWVIIILISLAITVVVMLILLSRHKMIRLASTARYYLTGINITNRQDRFITTFTTKTRIESSSGGSSGGGSSTHSSSSGSSHGGGSRGF